MTAITVLELGGRRLVLSSCGPSILLIDEKSGHVCSEVRAFKRHNVHGILTTGLRQSQGDHVREIFLAWGGSSLRLLCVSIDRDGSKGNISLSLKSAEHRAHDWILDAGFAVTQEPDAIWVALITAHNVLLALEFEKPFSAGTIELKIRELASGLNSVLYSADIAWVSTTQILVAAGTVFGEIVTWSCFLSPSAYESASTVIHHFFTGHEGSIFGVDISPPLTLFANSKPSRLLASCSDDRTIRIWDISDCSSSRSAVVDPGTGAEHKTGFGNSLSCGDVQVNPEGCICTTFGHISRIWGIKFFDIVSANGTLQVQLVSRGEDATTQIWIGTLRPNPRPESAHAFENDGVLSHVTTREYHSGKNVWSFASIENVDTVDIYSGGADGSIITYPISKIASSPSEDVSQDSVARKQDLSEKPKLNRYNFVSDIHILATSSQGKVFIGTIDNEAQQNDECDQLEVSWELLDIVPGLKDHSVIASNPCTGIAILCGLAGDVFIYGHADRSLKKIAQADQRVAGVYLVANGSPCISCAFVVSYMGRSDAHLFIFPSIDSANAYTTFRLQAPEKFVVTAAEYLQSQNCVVLGGRTGGLCLFNIDNTCTDSPISPSLNLEHVHGKDTVTSVMSLPKESDDSPDQMVLTTGRDGYYSVHRITQSSTSYAVRTIHRSSPPLGSSIEGAYIDLHTNDLILYGFRSTQFTIYNETAQSLVSATECGGAHRTWAFNHSASTEGRMTFAWTRASTFNLSSRVGLIQRSIRIGGHGREIKAMCSSPVVYKINNTPRKIVATGAEDTTIRLFAYVPESHTEKQGCFKCVLTLRKHTTGLQHLQFSPCGNYLFSSGGLEEFYVWRVRCIPGLGLGAVLEATCPKSTPKSDLRITSFDILNINGDETEDAFLVSLTYSNSEVRVRSNSRRQYHAVRIANNFFFRSSCIHLQLLRHLIVSLSSPRGVTKRTVSHT